MNCVAKSETTRNTIDPMAIQAPQSDFLLTPPTNESSATSKVEAEVAEAEMERSAFLRANPIHLTVPRWAVRNMDLLGPYPRHPACSLPSQWGIGPEERSAWFYSVPDGRCLWFSYAGHGGNANRFYSRSNCETLCVYDQTDLCQVNDCFHHCYRVEIYLMKLTGYLL